MNIGNYKKFGSNYKRFGNLANYISADHFFKVKEFFMYL